MVANCDKKVDMRQKMKRRWFACLWSIFLIFSLWTLVSFLKSKPVNSHDSKYRSAEDIKLKLVIVEEHHEVLGAWYEAYTNGVLPPNATLIHIDGHPDDGMPFMTEKIPKFRLPKNEEEVDHMTQANDVFIVAAQIAHLINRFVWIYPFWRDEASYAHIIQDYGTTVFRGKRVFCSCRIAKDDKSSSPDCEVVDDSSALQVTKIPQRLCKSRRQTEMEIIRDIFARTRLPVEKKWLGHDNLIVDIDEDFFGVHLVGNTLLSTGMKWRDVKAISELISNIVCPLIPHHEAISDRWFHTMIADIRAQCFTSTEERPRWCSDSKAAFDKHFRPFRSHKAYSKLFCQWEKSVEVDFDAKRAFISLWTILNRLTPTQLLAIQRTGICLQSSMRTLGEEAKLHLCIGSNTPNSSFVNEHWPSPAELSQQYDRIRTILQHLPTRPRIITLCRSSRDGYVPRALQGDIERKLISIIREVFKLSANDIVYDNLLLNGDTGDWYHRKY